MLRRIWKAISWRIGRQFYFREADRVATEVGGVDQGVQLLLTLKYQEMARQGVPLPSLYDVGFGVYSQSDEDGILLYIFALIGVTNRQCVEICAGDGIECNTANLIINHGWHGLMFDGSKSNVERGQRYYAMRRATQGNQPTLVQQWIDAETVDANIVKQGFEGEIDLFSLDIDGVDYWIWKAIQSIRPRVVVLEYATRWGPEKAVTVPYRRDFQGVYGQFYYMGASLPAFVKLGREKGYRLVGCNRQAFNAFFIREDILPELLPEVDVRDCVGPFVDAAHCADAWKYWEQYEWQEV